MKLQLKRSNVVKSGSAKEHTAAQLEYGGLAVNYNNGDPVILMQDSSNAVVRIAGAGAPGGGGGATHGLPPIEKRYNAFNLAVVAETGKGLAVTSAGIKIGDDWSNIPALV